MFVGPFIGRAGLVEVGKTLGSGHEHSSSIFRISHRVERAWD